MSKPDWDLWSQMPEVEPWQACALSLDIDPDSLREGYRNEGVHRVRSVDEWKSRVESRGYILPSKDIEKLFDKRLRLLIENIHHSEFFTPATRILRDRNKQPVRLSEFAAWALSRPTPWEIPPELASLAENRTSPIDATPESSADPDRESESQQDTCEKEHWINRNQVMAYFAVAADSETNKKFWDDKLGRPPAWLKAARMSEGRPGSSALWNPLTLAHCLLPRKVMSLHQLDVVMRKYFSEWEDRWKEETADQR